MTEPNQIIPIRLIAPKVDITTQPAPDGLDDIWPSLAALLKHMHWTQAQEILVQAQQRGMLRDGAFLLPSPFAHDRSDCCSCSWLHEDHVYYRFQDKKGEIYFWITGRLDRCYALETLWFPARSIALSICPHEHYASSIARFNARFEPFTPKQAAAGCVWAVIGFPHMLHMLWNELPAFDALATEGLSSPTLIGVRYEPFGPMIHLFPEFASGIRRLDGPSHNELNASAAMLVALGSWSISAGTQTRVRRTAASLAQPSTLAARDTFRAAHHPIFWISVKPPPRTLADQEKVLAELITGLVAHYPKAGFILNGNATPWDFPQNPNYPHWFEDVMEKASRLSAQIVEDILIHLDPLLAPRILALNAIPVCDEILYGEVADFYICHGGSMQNKIGWIHRIPGFIHSNRRFLTSFATMSISPVQSGSAFFLASDKVIISDDLALYTADERERKDENYRVRSIPMLLEEVLAAYATATASV